MLDTAIQQTEQELFGSITEPQKNLFSRKWWYGRLMRRVLVSHHFKTQMFRFVDVFPSLNRAADVPVFLKEYFGEDKGVLQLLTEGAGILPAALTNAFVTKQMKEMSRLFIIGEDIPTILPSLTNMRKSKISFTLDLLGEAVLSEVEADQYQKHYLHIIRELSKHAEHWSEEPLIDRDDRGALPKINISIKVSALDSLISPAAWEYSKSRIKKKLRPILTAAMNAVVFVNIDMEQYAYKALILETFKELISEPDFKHYPHFGIVIQAYLRDAMDDVQILAQFTKKHPSALTIRLVKGAYLDYEMLYAQQRNWPYPVYLNKKETDHTFESCARLILRSHPRLRLAIGSHNTYSIATAVQIAREYQVPQQSLEIQMLYGMADAFKTPLIQKGWRFREYCPMGKPIPGMAYLVRRLLENTSNESFLRQSSEKKGWLPTSTDQVKTSTQALSKHDLQDTHMFPRLKNLLKSSNMRFAASGESPQIFSKHNSQDTHVSPRLKNLLKSSNMRFAAKRACSRFAFKAELVLSKLFKRGDSHDLQNRDMHAEKSRRNIPSDSGAKKISPATRGHDLQDSNNSIGNRGENVTGDSPAPLGGFVNVAVLDFGLLIHREKFQHALDKWEKLLPLDVPIIIGGCIKHSKEKHKRENPSCLSQTVATISLASRDDCKQGVCTALDGFSMWKKTTASERSQLLLRIADRLERDRYMLGALQVLEVGKSWEAADADICEAIDFCRYYAQEIIQLCTPQLTDVVLGEESYACWIPRGVGVVIAPWNFPLAILTGMTAGCLISGNTVCMKPAEQSSATAYELMKILLECGVPKEVVQFLPGRGEEAGAYLAQHKDISVIAFTGSKEVGCSILGKAYQFNRTIFNEHNVQDSDNNVKAAAAQSLPLGGRRRRAGGDIFSKHPLQSSDMHAAESRRNVSGDSPLKKCVVEMGGKNAIIVDDSADLDLAVAGVAESAFAFQGQKCSACSRVLVAESIVERFTDRLLWMIQCLPMGEAKNPENHIGPVIDAQAVKKINSYIEIGKKTSRLLTKELEARDDYLISPVIFTDVPKDSPLLWEEIFGPVLVLIPFKNLSTAIRIANDTEFALTGAFYSRSPSRIQQVKQDFQVGNLYINRNCTGAIIKRHPFGGFKMSGLGHKAGGPDYLKQFMNPIVITENTVRKGGFSPHLV